MANATSNMNIRMDKEVKEQAQRIFAELGMDMTTAVNVFLRQAIRYNGFPFDVRFEVPNEETRKAIEEVQRLKADPHKKTYNSFSEILGELDDEQ